jgi:hypothetical protein
VKKEELLFWKKEAKNFFLLGAAVDRPRPLISQSFLVLFCKKEPFLSLLTLALITNLKAA